MHKSLPLGYKQEILKKFQFAFAATKGVVHEGGYTRGVIHEALQYTTVSLHVLYLSESFLSLSGLELQHRRTSRISA